MTKLLTSIFILAATLLAQVTPEPLRIVRRSGLVASTIIDNRSATNAQCDFHSIYVVGASAWSVSIEHGDTASGPWLQFTPEATITNQSTTPVTNAFGYFPFIRVTVNSGSVSMAYAGSKGYYISPTVTGSGTSPYYTADIIGQTSITIDQITYGYPDGNIIVQCFGSLGTFAECGSINVNQSTFLVTIAFATSFTGSYRIYGTSASNAYRSTFNGQTSVSVPASTHQLNNPSLFQCYDASGNTVQYGTLTLTPAIIIDGGSAVASYDVTFNFSTSQTGYCIIWSAS